MSPPTGKPISQKPFYPIPPAAYVGRHVVCDTTVRLIIENNFEASSRCSQFQCKFLAILHLPASIHHCKLTAVLWDRTIEQTATSSSNAASSLTHSASNSTAEYCLCRPISTGIPPQYPYGTMVPKPSKVVERTVSVPMLSCRSCLRLTGYTASGIWFMPWIESTDCAGTNCSGRTGGGGGCTIRSAVHRWLGGFIGRSGRMGLFAFVLF
ncbi:hypothetical protein BDD12DRAFT_801099 [Trichophaea hybrida]|nr:hypothetical protein BDD12DRAFT_801099 [Trichophaea hybrida]